NATGTGGGGSGDSNQGVLLYNGGGIDSTGHGAITVTGIKGAGANSYGINTYTNAADTQAIGSGTTTGNITLIANTISLPNFLVETAGNVTIKPYNAATTIGVAGSAGTLQVTDAILNSIIANTVTIGRNDGSGLMRVEGWNGTSSYYNLALVTVLA